MHLGSPLTPWGARAGHSGKAPGVKLKLHQNQNIWLTKDLRYVSGVTKMHLGSPPDPWGPGGTWCGPQGVNLKFHQIKKFH